MPGDAGSGWQADQAWPALNRSPALAEPSKAGDLALCAAMSPLQPSFVLARQHTWSEPFHGVCLAIAVTYRSSVEICPTLLGISIDAWS